MNYDITIEDLVNALCEEQGIVLWKDVPGYEGLYQVSNTGLVFGVKRGHYLKVHISPKGYHEVPLYKKGIMSYKKVHRLVAQAFLPNPLNLPEVNHLDEDKSNCNAANLEWCDRYHQMSWGTCQKRKAFACGKSVLQYTLDGQLVAQYETISDASRHTNLNTGNISRCCNGVYQTSGGYIWKYATEEKKFHSQRPQG